MVEAPVSGWENFFVAEVGASAALSGLLFVAVSINLTRILASTHLPARAAETLVMILAVLAIASFGLVPGQGVRTLGAEIFGVAGLTWFATVRAQIQAIRDPEGRKWIRMRAVMAQAATLPFVVGGLSLLCGRAAGIYWVVPGTIASFGAAALNAWVLLVEIQR
jgi:hypothetical protein